ncbi:alpha/beta hydrolase [Mycobacterium sp. AZCC_0083]|uniref:alpha/beta hydrolase n=1 Tax=Mycobacterium sp. AZCC_0083 TaxID=2735882 RepID=UPI00178DE7A4|nr:alpha/beta hydrolase [Mycobacterium sp. AZCC_0083]MBB5163218.1 hypothetical protein [Mycobacterium sp. AZCC_0083]
MNRRNLMKLTGTGVAALGALSIAGCAAATTDDAAQSPEWDKTFPPSDLVNVERVSFVNRLGIDLVGDLSVPTNLDRSTPSPAVIVGHPYGGVKEQTSGLYAQQMATRGFVALAFDNSYGARAADHRDPSPRRRPSSKTSAPRSTTSD